MVLIGGGLNIITIVDGDLPNGCATIESLKQIRALQKKQVEHRIKSFPLRGQTTRPFTVNELEAFFDTFDTSTRQGRLNRLYFLAKFYLGNRKRVADMLNYNYINWQDRLYYVQGDKGYKSYLTKGKRPIPIPYELFYHLKMVCEENIERIMRHNGYIFSPDVRDFPSESKYQKLFREHIRKAGLERLRGYDCKGEPRFDLVTHSFRSAYAVYLLENGCDSFTLMELMGHGSLLATQPYIRLCTKRKKDVVNRIFNGRAIKYPIKALILCKDTPYIETKEDIVNISVTREQVETLEKIGVVDSMAGIATFF